MREYKHITCYGPSAEDLAEKLASILPDNNFGWNVGTFGPNKSILECHTIYDVGSKLAGVVVELTMLADGTLFAHANNQPDHITQTLVSHINNKLAIA